MSSVGFIKRFLQIFVDLVWLEITNRHKSTSGNFVFPLPWYYQLTVPLFKDFNYNFSSFKSQHKNVWVETWRLECRRFLYLCFSSIVKLADVLLLLLTVSIFSCAMSKVENIDSKSVFTGFWVTWSVEDCSVCWLLKLFRELKQSSTQSGEFIGT